MPGWPLPAGEPAIYPASPAGVTAPTLANWQFQYQGITFGAGTALEILKVSGISGLPTVKTQDQAFPRDTGEYTGENSLGGRDITISFVIKDNLMTAMEDLGSAFSSLPYLPEPLWFQLPGFEVMCSMCRPTARDGDWDVLFVNGTVWEPTVTLHANDPRLYGEAQTASGGNSSTVTVTNAGNCEVRPVVLFPKSSSGMVTNTTIGDNAIMALNSVIATGDTVVVDMATPHTAIYWPGGISSPTDPVYSVFNWIDRTQTTWWTLVPGDNAIDVSLPSASGAEAQIWWSSAYML